MANKKTPPQSRGCFRVSSGTAFDASRGIATPRPATEATGGINPQSGIEPDKPLHRALPCQCTPYLVRADERQTGKVCEAFTKSTLYAG